MRLRAKTGSIKTRIKVSAKKMSELSEPFAAYQENRDPSTKRLLEVMDARLEKKKQMIEALIMRIKNKFESDNDNAQKYSLNNLATKPGTEKEISNN